MTQPFAHEAIVVLAPGGDAGAPGAAITAALCGRWEHEPPCPLAPHHTAAAHVGGELRLRTVFAAEPTREAEVRRRIRAALLAGELIGPGARRTRWQLRSEASATVGAEDIAHVSRLSKL